MGWGLNLFDSAAALRDVGLMVVFQGAVFRGSGPGEKRKHLLWKPKIRKDLCDLLIQVKGLPYINTSSGQVPVTKIPSPDLEVASDGTILHSPQRCTSRDTYTLLKHLPNVCSVICMSAFYLAPSSSAGLEGSSSPCFCFWCRDHTDLISVQHLAWLVSTRTGHRFPAAIISMTNWKIASLCSSLPAQNWRSPLGFDITPRTDIRLSSAVS